MDRQQTEAMLAEAQRLRTTLVEASVRLAGFTKQLRDLLDLAPGDDVPDSNEEESDGR